MSLTDQVCSRSERTVQRELQGYWSPGNEAVKWQPKLTFYPSQESGLFRQKEDNAEHIMGLLASMEWGFKTAAKINLLTLPERKKSKSGLNPSTGIKQASFSLAGSHPTLLHLHSIFQMLQMFDLKKKTQDVILTSIRSPTLQFKGIIIMPMESNESTSK